MNGVPKMVTGVEKTPGTTTVPVRGCGEAVTEMLGIVSVLSTLVRFCAT
jgi:hypothetical protein